jgi:uncharacterized membrane protein YdbT with pleckstrin-like domain
LLSFSNVLVTLFAVSCGGSLLLEGGGRNFEAALALLVWVLGFPVVYGIWLIATWRTTHYVVTNRRVYIANGIMRRDSFSIPLVQVTNVSSSQGAVDRLLGSGDLAIESAGRESAIVLHRLPHIKLTHTRVLSLLPAQRPPSAGYGTS